MRIALRAVGIIAMLLLVAIPIISSASAEQNVCRDLPAGDQTAGSEITVSLAITVDSATFYAIDEMIPTGWTVTGASNGGDYTSDPGHVKWVVTSGAADTTYTYTVHIPAGASGSCTFSGIFQMEGMSVDEDIDCDKVVTVVGVTPTPGEQDVCRDLPAGDQTAGSVITVSLATTVDSATFYAIDEMVPAGWTVTGASGGGDYTSDPGHVKWVVTSGATDTTYTYTVQIPGSASGSYTFSGIFQMEGMSVDEDIGCDTVVTVAGVAPGEQNVCRDLPAGIQSPGSVVTVSLATTVGSATFYAIDEMVPAGWTVTGASDDGDFTANPGHVYWVVTSGATDTTYTYTVQIPGSASDGTYTFNGIFQMEGMSVDEDIYCDTVVTVSSVPVASATRTLPATVLRGDTFTVGMSVADYGTSGNVMETLPPGFAYVDSDLDPSQVMVDGNMVTFNLTTETSFEYTVMASMMEGDYTFSGIIKDEEANEYPVGGDTLIEVLLPDGIVLSTGWNYISVPYNLNDSSVVSVMEGVTFDALTYYNAETGLWDPVLAIEPLKAYWIHIPVIVGGGAQVILEENLEPMMPASPSFIMVYAGWNAIGYTDSTDTLSAELTLTSIDDSYTTVVGPWNPVTMMYDYFGHNGLTGPISGKHVGTDVFNMDPYEGYWVYATEDGVLNSIGM